MTCRSLGLLDWADVRTYGNNNLVAGLILNIAYGYNVRDCEDPLIGIADEATRNTVKAGGPGAMLCDMFPLRKLTMRGSHRSLFFGRGFS